MLEAVGMRDSEGKKVGYRIQHNGKVYEAVRTPDERFECDGFVGTLKQVKLNIKSGGLDHFADADKAAIAQQGVSDVDSTSLTHHADGATWDCVSPCAMLILFCTQLDHPEVLRTLDAYGWLLPDGTPNIEDARVQMKKRQKQNGGTITG